MAGSRKVSEHAQEMAKIGASKGGRARANALSPEERQEIARQAAQSRWNRDGDLIPRASFTGVMKLGNQEISCAVLENEKRLLTQETFLSAVGRAGKAKGGRGSARLVEGSADSGLPPFLAPNLRPFTPGDVLQAATPIVYRNTKGVKAYGYEASLLPKVCEVYLKARDAGALLYNQQHLAVAADILMRALAHVGIVALVDEATGFQAFRARDELNRILEAYIAKELLPWTKHFPDEFFQEIYRLQGWSYRVGSHQHPKYVGKLIYELVYKPLPNGVLEELQRLNPITPKGYRRHRHFQFLSEETGNPHLDKQIVSVMTLMRASETKAHFKELFDRVYSKSPHQLSLFPEDTDE